MIRRVLRDLSSRLSGSLELRQAPTSDDLQLLQGLGIEPPRHFPAGPAPERWPQGIPDHNLRGRRDRRFLPWNWCTGILALALWLLLTLAFAMVMPLIEAHYTQGRSASASAYHRHR